MVLVKINVIKTLCGVVSRQNLDTQGTGVIQNGCWKTIDILNTPVPCLFKL